jgi:hypothetical protein
LTKLIFREQPRRTASTSQTDNPSVYYCYPAWASPP